MKRILIIDDEDGIRDIIQFSLESLTDWQVIVASSGTEGLTKANTEVPDAILLDMMMPNMDGLTTFNHLQSNPTTQSISTILLTAKDTSTEIDTLIDIGIVGAIGKPFEPRYLVTQIKKLLNW